MKTPKQRELVESFLLSLSDELRPVYRELAEYLSELGYNPKREKSNLSFKHEAHNKQIAKMKADKNAPHFALRFSACRGLTERFDGIVAAWMAKNPTRAALCPSGGCRYCSGKPETHVYSRGVGGERKTHCGAYALDIPNLTAGDLDEIKKLIDEEHAYLMIHEAGISTL